ncbi:MAG: ABC transporter ATP-binding protein [Fimbriimonadaceae bacterium]|nr:ABC transporter ATP-binding protein [Fimbriimonadaceae bacterium]
MAQVTLERVRKAYGDVVAVKDVDLEITDGEFLVLVGPSGCGKSTCLRLIAGLEEATGGTIRIGDRVVNDVPPQDRDIAMVFQNYALYPHMSVYNNLAFGLRLRREPTGQLFPRSRRALSETDIRQRVDHAARLLGIGELLHRKPRELSGGQRQRVALGRAIVREPQVFLMDEPLSNLDAKLRVQTRALLITLHESLQAEGHASTTVYVTHDQTEALTMGDRIAVLKDGVLQQCAPPLTLYREPVNVFVAQFIGSPQMNVVGPWRVDVAGGQTHLRGPEGIAVTTHGSLAARLQPLAGRELLVGVRPEDVTAEPGSPEACRLPVSVKVREPLGATVHLTLEGPAALPLLAVVAADTPSWQQPQFEASFEPDKVQLFDPQTELRIA